MRLPIDRFCNLVYAWLMKRINPEQRQEVELELAKPLPWQSVQGQLELWSDEDEAAAWASFSVA